jgi:alpha-L-fucosidase
VSQDGKIWIPCETSGEFSNIKNNPIKQEVQFKMVYTARYIRFEALREMDNRPFVTMGELGILQ